MLIPTHCTSITSITSGMARDILALSTALCKPTPLRHVSTRLQPGMAGWGL